jgi:hypothetical protein
MINRNSILGVSAEVDQERVLPDGAHLSRGMQKVVGAKQLAILSECLTRRKHTRMGLYLPLIGAENAE